MNRLKKSIRSAIIGLLLSDVWSIELRQWVLPLIYFVHLLQANMYINVILLLCAILHKFYIDTYITDRYLSILLIFITIITNVMSLKSIYSIFWVVIIKDTMFYKKIQERRKREGEFYNAMHSFIKEYTLYEDGDQVCNLECGDDDDDN